MEIFILKINVVILFPTLDCVRDDERLDGWDKKIKRFGTGISADSRWEREDSPVPARVMCVEQPSIKSLVHDIFLHEVVYFRKDINLHCLDFLTLRDRLI